MKRLKLKRPAPGTVLGFIALMVALAGTAGALPGKSTVKKGDLAKGSVTAKALAPGAIHAKALAKGAVNARALAKGAVNARVLAAGAVGPAALAANAVTANAIAPDSIRAYALGPVSVYKTPIADLDASADLSTWTSSNTEVAGCSPGERLLSGGVVFTNPGNRRVAIIQVLPFSNSGVEGVTGQITSDSGGTATAEVQAICLR